MLAKTKIEKAITSCQRALRNLDDSNKRLSVGDLDHAKENVIAAIHLIIAEIVDDEGEF